VHHSAANTNSNHINTRTETRLRFRTPHHAHPTRPGQRDDSKTNSKLGVSRQVGWWAGEKNCLRLGFLVFLEN
jgi:hypothetical protein